MKPVKTRRMSTKLLSVIMAASLTLSDGMVVLAQPSVSDNDVIVTVTADTSDGQDTDLTDVSDNDADTDDVTDGDAAAADITSGDVSEGNLIVTPEGEPLFSGVDDYVLSAEQIERKQNLADHLSDIPGYDTGYDTNAYVSGQVVFLTDSVEEAQKVAEGFNGTLESCYSGVAVINLPEDRTVVQAVAAAASEHYNLPAVWPNYYQYISATYNDPLLAENASDYQWFHEAVGDEYVWQAGYTGKGIKIGIIDTGALSGHEELSARVKKNVTYVGQSSPKAVTTDGNGHGTHVSGIAAASYNNKKGGAGVAPEADLYVYGVLGSDGSGEIADSTRAVNDAIQDHVDVINMSLGAPGYDGNQYTALSKAYEAGIAVFAAAGNDDSDTLAYPACYGKMVCSVGALQQDGRKAYFSNYNSIVRVAFPGLDINSTSKSGTSSYEVMSGTSMACPVATGTAAVILSGASDIPALKNLTGSKKVDALISIMQKNAVKSPSAGMGAGTTYLPKVFGITPDRADAVPAAPVFDQPNKTTFTTTTATVKITSATTKNVSIYYSVNGKVPSLKNGAVVNGRLYSASGVTIGNAKSVTLKAIAVNLTSGTASKVTSATYTFAPNPTAVTVDTATGVTSLLRGGSMTLSATVTPYYATPTKITWSDVTYKGTTSNATGKDSGSQHGVTIKNGKISASKEATIGYYSVQATATPTDKTRTDAAKTTTFTFNVVESSKIKSITPAKDKKSVSLINGGAAINADKTNLAEGLTVTYTDGTSYTYNSDNTVTYSDGTVAKTAPNDLVWKVTGTSVVSLSAAHVAQATRVGKATVSVSDINGSGKTATIAVNVTQAATTVTISGTDTIAVGKSVALSSTVRPSNAANKKLVWEVESGEGITVNNGKVTAGKNAVAGSTVKVKATAADGCGATATYTLKVVPEAIQSITLPAKSISLFTTSGYSSAASGSANSVPTKAPTSYSLAATVTGGTTSAVTYTSSAPNIAYVNSSTGLVTARAAGKAVITCMATDGSGKKATCNVTVSAPMSSLQIVATSENTEMVSVGTTMKLGTKIGTEFGKVQNTKVIWSVADSDKDKISVSSSGVVKARSLGASAGKYTNSTTATVYATAADGSGLTAKYEIRVLRKIKKYKVVYSKGELYPYVVFDNNYTADIYDYSVSIKSPGNVITGVQQSDGGFGVYLGKSTKAKKLTAKFKVTFNTGGKKSASTSLKFRIN